MITMTDRELEMYDYMVESGITTANELNLAKYLVNGTWEEVLNAVLYARTGYRSFDQYIEPCQELASLEDELAQYV